MKVILSTRPIYPFAPWGGIEKSFYYMSRYLIAEGIDVEIITPSVDARIGEESVIFDNIKYTFLSPAIFPQAPSLSWLLLFAFSRNLAKYLKKKDFDILHSYDITPLFYLRSKNRVPVIVTTYLLYRWWRVSEYRHKEGFDKYIEILAKRPGRYLLRRPVVEYLLTHGDAIVSEGDFQTEEIMKMYKVDRQKFFNVPPAVNISYIKEILGKKLFTRAKLGLDDNDFVLMSVNRLSPEKGIRFLIEAFSLVQQMIKNSKLILVGTGPEEGRILNQIRRYGLINSVVLLKNVPEEDLYTCYGLSDIYVSPTLQTDFIQGIEEAMACRLPIVSTGQDWLVKSGINGFVVPQRNPKMIANTVFEIYEKKLGKKMGARSEEMVKKYDWKVVVRKIIRKYEELSQKSKRY